MLCVEIFCDVTEKKQMMTKDMMPIFVNSNEVSYITQQEIHYLKKILSLGAETTKSTAAMLYLR